MTVQSPARKPDSVAMRILTEVADVRDVDPVSLTPPLASVVDPDALESIASAPADATVEFSYAGCRITLSGDDVDVTPLVEGNDS